MISVGGESLPRRFLLRTERCAAKGRPSTKKKPMGVNSLIIIGLFLIFGAVLVLPFKIRLVERNLEPFLFLCGVLALSISGFYSGLQLNGRPVHTGWSWKIITEALAAPVYIPNKFHLPVGIVQAVLAVGLIIHKWHRPIHRGIQKLIKLLSLHTMVFLLVVALGLLSSVISAILAALILAETVNAMPLAKKSKVDLTVIACFSIGLGAALTPLGEPLSTITVAKLAGEPYHAGFDFLFARLAVYIIPGLVAFGLVAVTLLKKTSHPSQAAPAGAYQESLKDVLARTLKVYVFIMALVFLGEGFRPIIIEYVAKMSSQSLYWINTFSAILDNATLAAAEIGPAFSLLQIKGALMGLIIAGGMLIPGNIPNIISAGKLGISSREWARLGVPLGAATMIVYFLILYLPGY